jgi:hypothetical protein
MCGGSKGLIGAALGLGAAYLTGGASVGLTTLAAGASLGSTIGGLLDKPSAPDAPAATALPPVATTSPIADDQAAKAAAEGTAVQDKNARLKLARSASLLSNTNGGAGDLSTADVAKPGAKSLLGA